MTEKPALKRASIGARRNPAAQQAILDAANAILLEEGLAGFSIEAVARRARAGKPTIYRWWPNRTALLLDVYHRAKADLPEPDTGTLEGDARMFLTNLLAFWSAPAASTIFRSIIAEAQGNADAMKELRAYVEERRGYIGAILERACRRGEIGDGFDLRAMGDWLVAFAWHRLLTGHGETTAGEIETVAKIFAAGARAGGKQN